MKALILTYAPVTAKEKDLINNSNILKIAINSAPYKSDYRVVNDVESIPYLLINFEEQIIVRAIDPTVSDNTRVIYNHNLYMYGGTITAGIDFAIKQGAKDILLIADNTVYTKKHQDNINKGIEHFRADIYQYSKGNFNLPVKKIKDFIIG